VYVVQNAVAEMQQNLRGGMQFLEMDARNAGAGISASIVDNLNVPTLLLGGVTISMISGIGISDGGSTGSDNLYIIYLSGTPTHLSDSMPSVSAEIKVVDPAGFQEGMIAIIFDSSCANVFQVTEIQESNHLQHNPEGIFGMENRFLQAFGEKPRFRSSTVPGISSIRPRTRFTEADADHTVDNVLSPKSADDIEDLQVVVLDDMTERTVPTTPLPRAKLRIPAARTGAADREVERRAADLVQPRRCRG
jgi:hypothetical protein